MSTVYDSYEMTDDQKGRAAKVRDAFKKLEIELESLCPNKKRFFAITKTHLHAAYSAAKLSVELEGKDLG